MLDKLLNIGSAFDWITPSIAFAQDFIHGPVGDFGIPVNPYWGRREVKRLLNDHGVRVWGLMFDLAGDVLLFTVNRRQAEFTYYLLREQGIPVIYSPVDGMDAFS